MTSRRRRWMSVGELADRVGITPATLCEVLGCRPGDLPRWAAEDAAGG
ncbi:helix-turn-helix domain-containing protein [Streptomyces sp. JV178]